MSTLFDKALEKQGPTYEKRMVTDDEGNIDFSKIKTQQAIKSLVANSLRTGGYVSLSMLVGMAWKIKAV